MNQATGRNAANLDFLYARLDEVRISDHERQRAKAQLARAEAVAEAIARGIDLVKRLLKNLAVRPAGRPTNQAG